MADWTIKGVICTRMSAAGQFAVVQLVNDLYAITIDGRCLEVFTWHAGQLSECVEFMMRLASRSVTSAPSTPVREKPVPDGPSAAA